MSHPTVCREPFRSLNSAFLAAHVLLSDDAIEGVGSIEVESPRFPRSSDNYRRPCVTLALKKLSVRLPHALSRLRQTNDQAAYA